jgi:hypothetical protein
MLRLVQYQRSPIIIYASLSILVPLLTSIRNSNGRGTKKDLCFGFMHRLFGSSPSYQFETMRHANEGGQGVMFGITLVVGERLRGREFQCQRELYELENEKWLVASVLNRNMTVASHSLEIEDHRVCREDP